MNENLIYKDEDGNLLFHRSLTNEELETLISILIIIKTDRGL